MAAMAAAPMAAESAMEDIPSANSFLDTLTSVEILNNKNYQNTNVFFSVYYVTRGCKYGGSRVGKERRYA